MDVLRFHISSVRFRSLYRRTGFGWSQSIAFRVVRSMPVILTLAVHRIRNLFDSFNCFDVFRFNISDF